MDALLLRRPLQGGAASLMIHHIRHGCRENTCIFHLLVLTALRVLLLLLYLGIVITLYLAPLGIDSPCFMEHSQLPPKPALFGHRGAPMVSSPGPPLTPAS